MGGPELSDFTVKHYKDMLSDEIIQGTKCERCGNLMLPPRLICNNCGNRSLKPLQYGKKGTVQALSRIHVPLTSFQEKCPYTVGIVKLTDGPMITGLLLGNENFMVGSEVEAVILKEEEKTILAFKPL